MVTDRKHYTKKAGRQNATELLQRMYDGFTVMQTEHTYTSSDQVSASALHHVPPWRKKQSHLSEPS